MDKAVGQCLARCHMESCRAKQWDVPRGKGRGSCRRRRRHRHAGVLLDVEGHLRAVVEEHVHGRLVGLGHGRDLADEPATRFEASFKAGSF